MAYSVTPFADFNNIQHNKRSETQNSMWVFFNLLGLRCASMEVIDDDDPFESSSSIDQKVEPLGLLEESWFFGNLLDRRTKMLRCYSDPSPSSNQLSQEMLVRDSFGTNSSSPTKKLPEDDGFVRRNLIRAPSLPHCKGNEEVFQAKETDSGMSKLTRPSLHHNLIRTPSLPPCIGREEVVQEKGSNPRMGKLTRQASLNSSDILPPRHNSKGMMTQSCTIPRHGPRPKLEVDSMNMDGFNEMRRRYLNQSKIRKSLSDLEIEEVQGFKDLGFKFDKEDLNPSVVDILPGLQEKNRVDSDHDKVRRPYLSEAWLVQSPPPLPNWVDKRSAEDVKAQIKFWARAVASNLHQEC